MVLPLVVSDGTLRFERVLYVLLDAKCLETGYVSSTAFFFVHRVSDL